MNFDNKKYRINFQIKSHSVRVSHNSNQLGVLPTDKARQYAQSYGLDLIEVVPNASPPVCVIDDFGKFSYENKIIGCKCLVGWQNLESDVKFFERRERGYPYFAGSF